MKLRILHETDKHYIAEYWLGGKHIAYETGRKSSKGFGLHSEDANMPLKFKQTVMDKYNQSTGLSISFENLTII